MVGAVHKGCDACGLVLCESSVCPLTVADPGFLRGGGANPKGGDANLLLSNFSLKLHENEEILGQRGASLAPPLRSATALM